MKRALLASALVLVVACDGEQGDDDPGTPPDTGTGAMKDAAVDSGGADAAMDGGPNADAGSADTGTLGDGGLDGGLEDGGALDASGTVTLSVATTSTGGAVYSTPGAIACTDPPTGPCSEVYSGGTRVVLTASAAADFGFDRWTGDCTGALPMTTVVMDADRSCTAHFIGTAGEIALEPPPLSVVPNETEDPVNIIVFREQENLAAPAAIPLDIHVPGRFASYSVPPGELPPGLLVNVYFLHFDPPGATTAITHRVATLQFPERIVGLITAPGSLDATDTILGLPTVLYPPPGGHPNRGIELNGIEDVLTLRGDRRHLDIDFETSSSSDQLRIITLATPGAEVPFLHNTSLGLIAPPASVVVDQTQSSTVAFLFPESSGLVLTAPLDVDLTTPGSYATQASVTPGTIAAGTRVRSWLIHFDPVGGANQTVDATVTFDHEILGLAILVPSLEASDAVVGDASVAYPAAGSDPNRSVELANQDEIRWGDDNRSLELILTAGTGTDQVRVILAD